MCTWWSSVSDCNCQAFRVKGSTLEIRIRFRKATGRQKWNLLWSAKRQRFGIPSVIQLKDIPEPVRGMGRMVGNWLGRVAESQVHYVFGDRDVHICNDGNRESLLNRGREGFIPAVTAARMDRGCCSNCTDHGRLDDTLRPKEGLIWKDHPQDSAPAWLWGMWDKISQAWSKEERTLSFARMAGGLFSLGFG